MTAAPPHPVENPGDKPRVVGLDLSLTATGIALADGTAITAKSAHLRGEPRLVWVRRQVAKAVGLAPTRDGSTLDRPTVVVIEAPAFMAKSSHQFSLGQLAGVVKVMLYEAHVPYVEVVNQRIKTLATGRGNAPKPEVLKAAWQRLGYEGTDDNQADALWLRQLGLLALGVEEVALPVAHLHALTVSTPKTPSVVELILSATA